MSGATAGTRCLTPAPALCPAACSPSAPAQPRPEPSTHLPEAPRHRLLPARPQPPFPWALQGLHLLASRLQTSPGPGCLTNFSRCSGQTPAWGRGGGPSSLVPSLCEPEGAQSLCELLQFQMLCGCYFLTGPRLMHLSLYTHTHTPSHIGAHFPHPILSADTLGPVRPWLWAHLARLAMVQASPGR